MAVRKTEDPLDRYIMSDEEWRQRFDETCQILLGISGDEFTARWDAGEYGDPDEHPQRDTLWGLSMLIPRAFMESR